MLSSPTSPRSDRRLVLLALVGVLRCLHVPALADHLTPLPPPGVIVANIVLSDNGDDDGFADTNETVEMRLTVRNMTGGDLTRLVLLLATDDPSIECTTVPMIEIGSLPAGEFLLTEPFVFKVDDVNRVSVDEAFSVTFDLIVATAQNADLAVVPTITLDLDLDVSDGSGPTTFFEGFESGGLGAFTTMHLDEGLGGSATDGSDNDNADGYRCQYTDPDWINSNNYNFGGGECYLNPTGAADAFYWQTSVDRAYSGTWSLYFGIPLPELPGFTTPLAQLEAVRTTDPINLGWEKVCSGTTNQGCTEDAQCPIVETCVHSISQLSIKHQISLWDNRGEPSIPRGQAADRAVVHVQVADAAGSPVGDWIKVYPNRNLYDQSNWKGVTSCMFDPIDDGNDEDAFFDPTDPQRRFGPSSTCFPELTFVHLGDTDDPFDPGNIGNASDGPGLEGSIGTGSWVESVFDLDRFRGRRVRVRFLETSLKDRDVPSWDSLFSTGPTPWDDGWWIDDVQITNTLTSPASVLVDTKDNSLLPGLTDDDGDGVLCDNCPETANPVQTDSDGDLVGDACDPCPLEFATNDSDADGHCKDVDNCPFTANADQSNNDGDSFGDVCDNCPNTVNANQADRDGNGVGDACNDFEDADGDDLADPLDNCPAVFNTSQQNSDGDSLGNACDNCPGDYNPRQDDRDADGEGDHCDLNDNLIYITFSDPNTVDWQDEFPFVAFNSYRGELDTLQSTGIYTQAVGSNPLAAQVCGLTDPFVQDPVIPDVGAAAFYLTTGVTGTGIERPLGPDSAGNQRPNSNPCP